VWTGLTGSAAAKEDGGEAHRWTMDMIGRAWRGGWTKRRLRATVLWCRAWWMS